MFEPSETSATIDDIKIGDYVVLEKTISESDAYLFGGITGDLHAVHVNERYMKNSPFGKRIVQGALVLSFASSAAGAFGNKYGVSGVSAGYDRIRLLKPVFFGDTIRAEYRVARIDRERSRSHAELKFTNQNGELVLVGEHIIKVLSYGKPESEQA